MRGRFLARAAEILASSLDYERTLRNVAWLAVPEIADWCAIDLVDEHGNREQVVAAHPDPEKLELAWRLRRYEAVRSDPDRGVGEVIRTGASQLYPEIDDELIERAAIDAEHLRLLRAVGMRSALIVPMRDAKRTIGTMTLVNAESGRRFSDDDREFAERLAAQAAVAVENARHFTQRSQIASTLQQSLLPTALPEFDGWELAAIYRPAQRENVEVGGDFYDAFETARGRFALIGDVTGKGVDAAAMTSLVRYGARFLADELDEPAAILTRLDAALRRQPELSLCSALCMRLADDRVVFSSAGHPLPLHVRAHGTVAVGETGPVLGAFDGAEWPSNSLALGEEEALILYTDGVTDAVGESDRFGEERLCEALTECGPRSPALLLDCLERKLIAFRAGPWADDIAAVALRRPSRPRAPESGG